MGAATAIFAQLRREQIPASETCQATFPDRDRCPGALTCPFLENCAKVADARARVHAARANGQPITVPLHLRHHEQLTWEYSPWGIKLPGGKLVADRLVWSTGVYGVLEYAYPGWDGLESEHSRYVYFAVKFAYRWDDRRKLLTAALTPAPGSLFAVAGSNR